MAPFGAASSLCVPTAVQIDRATVTLSVVPALTKPESGTAGADALGDRQPLPSTVRPQTASDLDRGCRLCRRLGPAHADHAVRGGPELVRPGRPHDPGWGATLSRLLGPEDAAHLPALRCSLRHRRRPLRSHSRPRPAQHAAGDDRRVSPHQALFPGTGGAVRRCHVRLRLPHVRGHRWAGRDGELYSRSSDPRFRPLCRTRPGAGCLAHGFRCRPLTGSGLRLQVLRSALLARPAGRRAHLARSAGVEHPRRDSATDVGSVGLSARAGGLDRLFAGGGRPGRFHRYPAPLHDPLPEPALVP